MVVEGPVVTDVLGFGEGGCLGVVGGVVQVEVHGEWGGAWLACVLDAVRAVGITVYLSWVKKI